MHETVRAQKPLLTATSALLKLLTYKQQDDTSMSEYIKTFIELRDMFTTQWGKHITDYFVEQQSEYKALQDPIAMTAKIKEETFDEWMGLLFLLNADWQKYGLIKNELAASYTRGRDGYPESLKSAIDYLDTHVTVSTYKEYKKKQKQDRGVDNKSKSEKSFAQKSENIQCYCCVFISPTSVPTAHSRIRSKGTIGSKRLE